ncbi:hypothetical protein THAOC_30697 [Thalassiosira oceanica]|uniref:Uncharacterized protein n=1 Tax=Thalassiosira oceanica TaxID=159749 RepID=K0RN59_THAOC|nr:hypothetical protein THAOC_30697 [Thalassiosira oceanica]|eukprot:EJK50346.1 hypothetical protein THAOC_30697 [Thalassiosira oceanica]
MGIIALWQPGEAVESGDDEESPYLPPCYFVAARAGSAGACRAHNEAVEYLLRWAVEQYLEPFVDRRPLPRFFASSPRRFRRSPSTRSSGAPEQVEHRPPRRGRPTRRATSADGIGIGSQRRQRSPPDAEKELAARQRSEGQ